MLLCACMCVRVGGGAGGMYDEHFLRWYSVSIFLLGTMVAKRKKLAWKRHNQCEWHSHRGKNEWLRQRVHSVMATTTTTTNQSYSNVLYSSIKSLMRTHTDDEKSIKIHCCNLQCCSNGAHGNVACTIFSLARVRLVGEMLWISYEFEIPVHLKKGQLEILVLFSIIQTVRCMNCHIDIGFLLNNHPCSGGIICRFIWDRHAK